MARSKFRTAASASGAIALCHSANCAAIDVVVGFGGPPAIPISNWAVAAMAGAIAFVAYRVLRSSRGSTSRGWIGALIVSASIAALTAECLGVGIARALVPGVLALDSSPGRFTVPPGALSSMSLSGGGYGIIVSNQTGRAVWITDRGIEDNSAIKLSFYLPGEPELPECTVGLSLAPGALCYLYVYVTNHFS